MWRRVAIVCSCVVGLSGVACGETDIVGVMFRVGETWTRCGHASVGVLQDAYLVIQDPSVESGVSGWECTIATSSNVEIVEWDIGSAFNLYVPPEFEVGIGEGVPLPYASVIPLMRMRYRLIIAGEGRFYVRAGPGNALGSGCPVYAAGDDAGDLRSLGWVAGCDSLPAGFINSAVCDGLTGVESMDGRVADRDISACCYGGVVRVVMMLDGGSEVSVDVFDLRGRLVCNVVNGYMGGGRREVLWWGTNRAGGPAGEGVYLVRVRCDGSQHVARVLLTH